MLLSTSGYLSGGITLSYDYSKYYRSSEHPRGENSHAYECNQRELAIASSSVANVLWTDGDAPMGANVRPNRLDRMGFLRPCESSARNTMRVFLIYVRSQKISSTSIMPLGILYIGGLLEREGHEVQVIDTLYEETESVVEGVRQFEPELVGFSFLTTEYKLTRMWRERFADVCPDAIFVAGGAHMSSPAGDNAMQFLDLHYGVFGEGETTSVELLRRIDAGEDPVGLPGLIWRDQNGEAVRGLPAPLIQDLDGLPNPARHLLVNTDKYLTPPGYIRGYLSQGTLTLYTSRGCPAHCIFCDSHIVFGRTIRRRSVQHVMDEIEHARQSLDFETIFFADDTFTLDKKWVTEFCDAIGPTGIKWGCETRVSTVTPELLMAMKEAGCVQVDYGVESGSPAVLKTMKKGQTRAGIVRAFELTRAAGMRTFATMIVGLPSEGAEQFMESVSLVKEIKPDFLHVTIATPFPGTELWNESVERGWIDPVELEQANWDFVNTAEPVLKIQFSGAELKKMRNRLQNANLMRSYSSLLTIRNIKYVVAGGLSSLKHPLKTLKALRIALRTRNMDEALMHFNRIYQVDYLAKRRRFEASEESRAVYDVNPNHIR